MKHVSPMTAGELLHLGTQLVWVVDTDRRIARVYRADGSESIISASESLDGETTLPEFSCPLASVLA